ncbi:hypothetical protein WH47_06184, partial [Habropoda laboriosa]
DGDYETSSEGAIRERDYGTRRKQVRETPSQNSQELGSERDYDARSPNLKEDKSSEEFTPSRETVLVISALTKSESMPVLKSTFSSREDNEMEDVVVTSDSSLARLKKMKTIVARIGPLLSSGSSLTLSTNTSKQDMVNESHESQMVESKIELTTLQDVNNEVSISSKDVTFREVPEDQKFTTEKRSSSRDAKYTENPKEENDGLIDIAENPHPPIKSFYIPPVPEKEISSLYIRQQSRITKDLDALLKIDGELAPLQHQLNEIRGKFRALNLTVPSLTSQSHYPSQYAPSSSGYYLHRTETFGRDSKVNNVAHLMGKTMLQDNRSFLPPSGREMVNVEDSYSFVNPRGSSSKCVARNGSNLSNNSMIEANDSCVTVKNAYFQLENRVRRDPTGSLIPSVSSTCYRCYRNQTFNDQKPNTSSYYDELEAKGSNDTFVKQSEDWPSRPVHRGYTGRKTPGPGSVSGRLTETRNTSTTSTVPQVRMISVNTTLEKRYTDRILDSGNSYFEEAGTSRQVTKRNSNSNSNCTQDQSVSASLMAIKSGGNSRTRYLNFTRVNSRTSLVVSRKDQDVMTSDLEYPSKKKLQDLEIQCSALNVKYRQKEVVVQKSRESILKPSVSTESDKSVPVESLKSVQVTKTDEKVVVVPILFTDGVPEPPKVPMFHFTRSKNHLPKVSQHLVKLDKRASSITQSSVYSAESATGSTYLSQKLTNRNNGMSVSCVSGTSSSLRCTNASPLSQTAKTLSDFHRSRGKHSYASRAYSEPTKRTAKKVLYGMRSSPEDFLCET